MNGLIAFFDILGYQSFLENNSATESAEKVLKLITDIPQKAKFEVAEAWLKMNDQKSEAIRQQVIASLKHLIFSDTIVLSIEYSTDAPTDWKNQALIFLIAASGQLCRAMFKEGLPLRGAIVEGDFIVKDFCFAGNAIVVDAYKLCQTLNFSGVVFDVRMHDRINMPALEVAPTKPIISYLSPLNEGKEQKMYHINWVALMTEQEKNDLKSDIETFVLRSFWSHKKDCPQAVDSKIANTIKLVRRFAIELEKK